jgi:hypothetical protein
MKKAVASSLREQYKKRAGNMSMKIEVRGGGRYAQTA